MTNLDSNIKKQKHYFANKGPSNHCYGFSSSHVWMWELDYKECWALKNWCFWTVVLEKIVESPMDCKEIQPVHPKGNQSWILIGRTGAETPILWPPDLKNWLLRKDPDAGKDWRQEEKGTTEDEMVGWHYWLDGHEFEQAMLISDGQGSLARCSPWGHRVGHDCDWTELSSMKKHSFLNIPKCLFVLSFLILFYFIFLCFYFFLFFLFLILKSLILTCILLKECYILSNAFLVSIEMLMWFLSFILLIRYITSLVFC